MSTNTENPLSKIRRIPGELFKLDEKPLLGSPPAFPWDDLAAQFGKSLQISNVSIQPGQWIWRAQNELFEGLGDKLRGLPLTVTPIPGAVWWVMPEQELTRLMNTLLTKQSSLPAESIDDQFINAFYRFIAIEALNVFDKVNFDKKLSPSIGKDEELPKDHSLCLDITIALPDEALHGRLFLSPEFRKAWAGRYLQQSPKNNFSSPIADSLEVVVHLEAGRVNLKPSEWNQIRQGDFLLLDHCSLSPDEDKGRVMLVVNGTPYFRGKIKQGSLKILEHPLYYEVDTTMDKPVKKENDDNDFDDADLEDDLHDTSDEAHDDDFDLDEELNDIEMDPKAPATAPAAKPATPKPAPAAAKGVPPAAVEAKPGTPAAALPSIDEIPLNVVIEVGRVQMSIKKLLELQPGNMLELDIHPEAGVDLVVNGKRIARGELLRIGEALGVRIMEIS